MTVYSRIFQESLENQLANAHLLYFTYTYMHIFVIDFHFIFFGALSNSPEVIKGLHDLYSCKKSIFFIVFLISMTSREYYYAKLQSRLRERANSKAVRLRGLNFKRALFETTCKCFQNRLSKRVLENYSSTDLDEILRIPQRYNFFFWKSSSAVNCIFILLFSAVQILVNNVN